MVLSSPRSNESLLQSSLDSLPCMLFFYFSLDRLTLQFSRDLRNLPRIDSNDQRPAAISRKRNLFVIKICIRLRGSKFNKISVSKGERDFPETVVAYTIDSLSSFSPRPREKAMLLRSEGMNRVKRRPLVWWKRGPRFRAEALCSERFGCVRESKPANRTV